MKFSAVIAIAVIAVVASLAMVDATPVLPPVSDNHISQPEAARLAYFRQQENEAFREY
jgi:hypothetical protein